MYKIILPLYLSCIFCQLSAERDNIHPKETPQGLTVTKEDTCIIRTLEEPFFVSFKALHQRVYGE